MKDVDGSGGSGEGHGMDGSREEQMRGKMFERTAIIDWALRTSNGWMDDGG